MVDLVISAMIHIMTHALVHVVAHIMAHAIVHAIITVLVTVHVMVPIMVHVILIAEDQEGQEDQEDHILVVEAFPAVLVEAILVVEMVVVVEMAVVEDVTNFNILVTSLQEILLSFLLYKSIFMFHYFILRCRYQIISLPICQFSLKLFKSNQLKYKHLNLI